MEIQIRTAYMDAKDVSGDAYNGLYKGGLIDLEQVGTFEQSLLHYS